MPDPTKLLRTLEQARDKTLSTKGRDGHLLELTDVEDVYVVGDLHGNLSNFQAVYKQLELEKRPRRHLVLQELIHGKQRYPLGGEKSHQLVDLFSALKNAYPERVHYLVGNHELAQATAKPIMKNEEDLNAIFDDGVIEAYGERAAEVLAAYYALFDVCPLGIRLPNRVYLSHTTPQAKTLDGFELDYVRREAYEPEEFQGGGMVYSMLWGRDTSLEHTKKFLQKVDADWLVCGHIPCDEGFAYPNERLLVMDCARVPGGYAYIQTTRELDETTFKQIVRVIQ